LYAFCAGIGVGIGAKLDFDSGVGVELRNPNGELGRNPLAYDAAAENAAVAEKDLAMGVDPGYCGSVVIETEDAVLAAAAADIDGTSGSISVVAMDSRR